jgi:hypothetical protein
MEPGGAYGPTGPCRVRAKACTRMSWTIVASAKFYRRVSVPLTILGVTIHTLGDPPSARVSVTVPAASDSDARKAATELFEEVSGVTRLVLRTPLEPSDTLRATQDPNGLPGAMVQYLGASAVAIGSDVDSAAAAVATSAESAYAALSSDLRWQARFALRWYDRALAERDPADRFVAAWIALETAGYGARAKVQNILDVLEPIYATAASRSRLEAVLRLIYISRNELFHQAKLDVPTLATDAQRTLWFVEDILEARLGRPPLHRAVREHLV